VKYYEGYSSSHNGDWYKPSSAVPMLVFGGATKTSDATDLPEDKADYAAVRTALKSVPADLEPYTADSAKAVTDAVAAVDNGQADALVTDTPQCVYMVESEQLANGVVVGQIPGTEDPDGLGITLVKDSPLTPFVTDAMNAILDDGTVDGLIDTWLKAYTTDIPTLTE
jgi:ABC-type amino acid transport substrate-binding protein